mmetsp:Transcript_5633/g.9736  ORF Transcript_5633/g.9736 Transcript_5633/m.9736 type:complete len:117 (-) Transcript_5633:398-748(-)|eukprot:CAMPEP_0196666200 /NCGR_PEP_ID=MMETSP1086-20130531/64241_1 /TAXON_ID=77921 /ORGANISM="Cyanoptyche  gloeocystis , Strain SAG4.97" /LENGTH=116 /DNA_ID=CAMNT_0042003317 /DNA_START=94 /DNA_END=444 /DNA_ORIENTATION=-
MAQQAIRAACILLLLSSLICAASAGKTRGKPTAAQDKQLRARREECQKNAACANLTSHVDNCVLRCVSPVCYTDIFGVEELEEGEVDGTRTRKFNSCARKEIAEMEKNKKLKGKKT